MANTPILIIDDDPDLCELLEDALADAYDICITNTPDNVLELLNSHKPVVVILDVNLPKGNGLQLCEEISGNYEPMVLLISGDTTLELQLEAYNHGCADFMTKPFHIKELHAKVDTLHKLYTHQQQLKQTSEYATKTAMSAMAEASQYGEVLRFFNDMYKAVELEAIRDSFFALMQTFGLQSSIQFRAAHTVTYDFVAEDCSPIELQIYDKLAQSDRLISFSSRIMVNGTYASFIIKNMPVDDDVSSGRLRDILATVIEGLDAKLLDLQRLSLLKQTSGELASSSARLAAVMKEHEGFITSAMNHVISSINSSFHVLEMTEEQEQFFTKLTEDVLSSMEESFVKIGNETDVLDCLRLSLAVVLQEKGINA
ncbi:MAG: response regulator [Agarilytica sp.]